jgi:ribosomal protein S18 acetylase RimI-like enzyme
VARSSTPFIVPAGSSDAAALARVHVEAWRETYGGILPAAYLSSLSVPGQMRRFRRRLMIDSEFTLLAETASEPVGYCAGDWARQPGLNGAGGPSGEGEIHTLYVLRRAQRAGLGRALLIAGARVLAARGATSMVLWVLRDNAPARAFYERMGGRGEGVSGEWVGGGIVASVGYRWADLPGWLAAVG